MTGELIRFFCEGKIRQVPSMCSFTWRSPESSDMPKLASPGPQEWIAYYSRVLGDIIKHGHQFDQIV